MSNTESQTVGITSIDCKPVTVTVTRIISPEMKFAEFNQLSGDYPQSTIMRITINDNAFSAYDYTQWKRANKNKSTVNLNGLVIDKIEFNNLVKLIKRL